MRRGWLTLSISLVVLALGAGPYARRAWASQIEVCFSPPLPGGCDPARAIEAAIGAAHTSILVQAYEITPGPLVTALIGAHRRGVEVRAIVDYRQLTDRRNRDDAFGVERLGAAGIPMLVDRPPRLDARQGDGHRRRSGHHRQLQLHLFRRTSERREPAGDSRSRAGRAIHAALAQSCQQVAAPSHERRVQRAEKVRSRKKFDCDRRSLRRLPCLTGRSSATAAATSTNGRDVPFTARFRPPIVSSFRALRRPKQAGYRAARNCR